VGVVDPIRQQGHQRRRLLNEHRLVALFQPLGQGQARAVGRGDVADRADLSRLIHRHHLGVLQPGGGAGLALEALA
jgi:hypothetical protein